MYSHLDLQDLCKAEMTVIKYTDSSIIYRMGPRARPFFCWMNDDDICIRQLMADSLNRICQPISRFELHSLVLETIVERLSNV